MRIRNKNANPVERIPSSPRICFPASITRKLISIPVPSKILDSPASFFLSKYIPAPKNPNQIAKPKIIFL